MKNHSRGWIENHTFNEIEQIKPILFEMIGDTNGLLSPKEAVPNFIVKTYNEYTNTNEILFYVSPSSLYDDILQFKFYN